MVAGKGMGRRGRAGALGLLGVLGLTGCGGGFEVPWAEEASPSPTASVSTAPIPDYWISPPPPRNPTRTSTEACGGGDPFDPDAVLALTPGGPAYAGPGVHPVVLYETHTLAQDYGSDEPVVPEGWLAAPGEAQLVVCEYEDDAFVSETVGTCEYAGGSWIGDGTARVESMRYVYRVFEARTGELVDEFTLDGTSSPEETCPDSAYHPTVFFQYVEREALTERLRPLVEGTAGE
ncbi:hypothetical protein [Allostreptomyces psammosilenae]|uniref:Uncharacterized protein n=1 Tax=Allostreptomyces psammosilenae TaxID=1892865 RepID=A0A852ZPA3_9ACTN|nr:hypothetical protein [Allostreptomyces psammosilenae]NYI03555.1 hypothetical protein [Allostreptomyces psammosilenae]